MKVWNAILILCFIIVAIVPISAQAQSEGPIYIVQEGDTLYIIAQRFGTTIDELAAINNLAEPYVIIPDMELVIPGFEGVSGVLEFGEVAYGETLLSLSHRHQISEEALMKLNRVVHPGALYVGQPVIVTQQDGDELLAHSKLLLVDAGESKLEFSVRNGVNPWSLDGIDGATERAWVIGGDHILLPGGTRPFSMLPDEIREVIVTPERAVQGQTVQIDVGVSEDVSIDGWLGEWDLTFNILDDGTLVGLQGVHALADPGMYEMGILLSSEPGGEPSLRYSQPMRVASGGYAFDPVLYVPEETIDPEKTRPENELIASIVEPVTPERYWEGPFDFPSENITAFPSWFGSRRNYNNTGYTSYHTGLDFYGGVGTPIPAPARGKVVFAGPLDVRGNVTFIDHGWGVYTGYLHQSEIQVSVGDMVERGQIIGLIGRTGRVTGPHLHWEVWVGGVPVDPMEWTERTIP
ncbi:MAG: peptidoglycan DD-metalloendopeptidase family protein [Anaerolineales bacterium]|nr:peptidoglycan DD-metalloendopeptidase family protein [Anaerolineales bacterium]